MGFSHEFAPWRAEYFKHKVEGCAFCAIAENAAKDDENFVLFRAKSCFGVMNRYPYTLGEFMVIPYAHSDNIEELPEATWREMSELVRLGVRALKETLHAQGVNIGMNLGAAAGAGIAEHVHYHLVPRWARDTNFITTIAHTRVHGVPLAEQYAALKARFDEEIKKGNIQI